MKNKAFTLIELLVVVLIIGILAAIAVPQYQKAVMKSYFAKCQTMVASIKNAYNEYVLVHGNSPTAFTDLTLTLPSDFKKWDINNMYGSCMANESMACCINKYYYSSSTNYDPGYIVCYRSDLSFGYLEDLFTNTGTATNDKYCVSSNSDIKARDFCSNLGTYKQGRSLKSQNATHGQYYLYKIN